MLIDEVAQYIHNKTGGAWIYQPEDVGGNVYLGTQPSEPADCVTVYQRGGEDSDPFNEYTDASVQLIVRGENKIGTQILAENLLTLFNGFNTGQFVIGGSHIVDCLALQALPVDIGNDPNGLHEFSINLKIEFKRS